MRIASITAILAIMGPLGLLAQAPDVQKEVEELKQKVEVLEANAKAQEKALTKVETKVAQNNIAWGGDLTTRFDEIKEHFKPYQQFMGFIQNPGQSASNPYPFAPMAQQMGAQDLSNPVEWSTQLHLRMTMNVSENGKIMGRLTMYKIHGGADVPIFNGSPNTVANSFSSGAVPSSDNLIVERASFVYDWPKVGILSIGRQNTSGGPPDEVREQTERSATPQALAVNAMVDGMGFKFHLEPLGLPEHSLLGICYGVGFESGLGGGGSVASTSIPVGYNFTQATMANPGGATAQMGTISGLKDSTVLGAMLDVPLLFEGLGTVNAANFYLGYNRFGNMTDIPFGTTSGFPLMGLSSAQNVTATANLGDMDQWAATWKHRMGDTFTYFASLGYIKSHPNGQVSQYGAYWNMPKAMGGNTAQLSGFGGLLGDANHSETATATYVGMRWDPIDTLGFGLEFNHGSPRWFTYDPAVGEPTQKLGTRGNVVEVYAQWQFVHNVFLKVGYTDYSYSTAFSGWQIAPAAQSGSWEAAYNLNNNPMLQYASPSSMKNAYVSLQARF